MKWYHHPRWRWAVILPFVVIVVWMALADIAWPQVSGPESTTSWFLTQGVLGVTNIILLFVVKRLWDENGVCRKAMAELQDKHATRDLALIERVLTVLGATGSQLEENTRAIEMVLKRIP